MTYVFLRTVFLIVCVFQSTLTLTTGARAAVVEVAPDYVECPTVWTRYSVEAVAVHRTLMSKLPVIESLDSKISGANFAAAFFDGKLLEVREGDAASSVFISNHIHDFERGITYDCHRSRGFPREIIDKVKRVGAIFSQIKLPAPRGGTWFTEFADSVTRLRVEVLVPSEEVLVQYSGFDALENDYLRTYPFISRMSETYPCFDSEASIARYVTFKLSSEDFSRLSLLELRIHSRFNPCFFCVQMLHQYAQRWSKISGKPVRVFVSSHEVYPMPLEVMPEGHVVPTDAASAEAKPKPSMRLYGRDDRYDEKILSDVELESFTYFPDRPGKIIQTFFPESAGVEARVAASAAVSRGDE